MSELTPLEKLKLKVTKVSAKCAGQRAWDKWARRLLMGIDNSVEAATKALKNNEAAYAVKFPPEQPKSNYDDYEKMDEYPDIGNSYSGFSPSFGASVSSSPPPASSYDEEEPDDKPTKQQLKNQFVARSACCRAVMNWGEWTMTKEGDPARDDLWNEMEIELSVVDGALADI